MQPNKYVDHQDVKMYYATKKKIPGLKFLGPHNKPHCGRGLGKNYHMHFDTKVVYGTHAIFRISCECNLCTYGLDQT